MTLIYFLLMLLPVVTIHELGHFYVGKWMRIPPMVFSIGMGNEIYSRQSKDGTVWRLAMLPIGGYVKFQSDVNGTDFPNLNSDKTYETYRYRARIATLLAGPFANFAFSIILFFAYFAFYGPQGNEPVIKKVHHIESELAQGDRLVRIGTDPIVEYFDFYRLTEDSSAQISAVIERDGQEFSVTIPNPNLPIVSGLVPEGEGFKIGLEVGDLILSYGGETVENMKSLSGLLDRFGETSQDMVVSRDGQELTLVITPKRFEDDLENATPKIGFYSGLYEAQHVPLSLSQSAQASVTSTFRILTMSYDGIVKLITGEVGLKALSGPVGMAQMANESAENGFWSFVQFLAVISSAIGFLNLLPIPILDGGHIVLQTYEKIVGKLPPQRMVNFLFGLGFTLLIGLMSLATVQDLLG